jgi:hypothetical protein
MNSGLQKGKVERSLMNESSAVANNPARVTRAAFTVHYRQIALCVND